MDIVLLLKCLILLVIANGAPVLAWRLSGDRFNSALDFGHVLPQDNRPVFGPSKTIRGVIVALILTPAFAYPLGLSPIMGLYIALFAMLGDLLSSFIKRRLGLASSSMALGLDQIPESLLPMMFVADRLNLNWTEIGLIVALFALTELGLSRVLYKLSIRKKPY